MWARDCLWMPRGVGQGCPACLSLVGGPHVPGCVELTSGQNADLLEVEEGPCGWGPISFLGGWCWLTVAFCWR